MINEGKSKIGMNGEWVTKEPVCLWVASSPEKGIKNQLQVFTFPMTLILKDFT